MEEMITWLSVVQILGVAGTSVMATIAFLRLLGGASWNLSGRIATIESTVIAIQGEMKRLADVLVSIADVRGDLRVLDTRLTATEKDVRELRHGEGYVLPINKGAYEK